MTELIKSVQEQFLKMTSSGKLFRVEVSGSEIYNMYLLSFPDGTDPVFRDPSSSTHRCNACANFFKRYGNIVSINEKDGNIISLFGNYEDLIYPYKEICKDLDLYIKSRKIINVFFETYDELNHELNYESTKTDQAFYKLGTIVNYKKYVKEEIEKYNSGGKISVNDVFTFKHMNLDLPRKFVNFTGDSIQNIMDEYRTKQSVLKRLLESVSQEILNLVIDLINQDSLINGTSHLTAIQEILTIKSSYDDFSGSKDNYCWLISYEMSTRVAKFGNTLIGELCYELANGVNLNDACRNWNKRADPVNYMKTKAPISKKQIEEAQSFVEENGYLESFDRRLAILDDIGVENISHINNGNGKINKVTIFDNIKATNNDNNKMSFDNIEEISIEKFLREVVNKCDSVELYFQNKHENNLLNLTCPKHENSKPIFKWGNNFSWTFNGNIAGKSFIKEAVKQKGGNVQAVLRFSIMWAENDPTDDSDLDAHCVQPNGENICFSSNKYPTISSMSGSLDVDIIHPKTEGNKNIVENIRFTDIKKMREGTNTFWVNQYRESGSKGFRAEIEFDGNIYSYEYNKALTYKQDIQVAEVSLKKGKFEIKHILPETNSSKEIWNMKTNTFQKVNLICLSPNHWGENAIGNKHYFFFLEKAKTKNPVRGFHNENLKEDLLAHKKVMEVLGGVNMITPSENQLSGVGFNSTIRDEVILKLSGSFKRIIKIKI